MLAEPLPRVFFDGNEGSHDEGYWLTLPRSKSDLLDLGDRLRDGEEIIIYTPNELEMRATLRWEVGDAVWGSRWVADPLPGTISHIIYVGLEGEGTKVWRPVHARWLGKEVYEIMNEPASDEEWSFPPGSRVKVGLHAFGSGDLGLVALALHGG